MTAAPVQFLCGHCGAAVPWVDYHGQQKARNHCPECLWSKHVAIGENVGYPPCGGLMRGFDVGDRQAVWRCLDCGFTMRGPTDEYLFGVIGGMSAGFGIAGRITAYAGAEL